MNRQQGRHHGGHSAPPTGCDRRRVRKAAVVSVAATVGLIVCMDWIPTPLIHIGVLLSCGFSWLAFHQAGQKHRAHGTTHAPGPADARAHH